MMKEYLIICTLNQAPKQERLFLGAKTPSSNTHDLYVKFLEEGVFIRSCTLKEPRQCSRFYAWKLQIQKR